MQIVQSSRERLHDCTTDLSAPRHQSVEPYRPHLGRREQAPADELPTSALCALPGVDGELWTGGSAAGHAEAVAVCRRCGFIEACHELAETSRTAPAIMDDDERPTFRPLGVWAGLLYDGTAAPPTAVRVGTCATCGAAFGASDTRIRHCPTHRVTKPSRRRAA